MLEIIKAAGIITNDTDVCQPGLDPPPSVKTLCCWVFFQLNVRASLCKIMEVHSLTVFCFLHKTFIRTLIEELITDGAWQ